MKKLFAVIFILGISLSAGIFWWQSQPGKHLKAEEVTSEELRQMIKDENSFYVYFYSPTCKDCIKSEPLLALAVKEAQVKIVKMDVQKHQSAREEFEVPGTPTIFQYVDGKLLRGITGGYKTKAEYDDFFRQGAGGQ